MRNFEIGKKSIVMQSSKAKELRKQWKLLGDKPCNHSELVKEYDLGADTGDKVCTRCGKAIWNGIIDEQSQETNTQPLQ